jgi:hypothetical protein
MISHHYSKSRFFSKTFGVKIASSNGNRGVQEITCSSSQDQKGGKNVINWLRIG